MVQNGLTGAILGFDPGGMGTQLSQVDTLFKNNRWYLLSNMRQLLSQMYVEHGLIQTIIDVPVDDAFRGGIKVNSKQLSEDELQELLNSLERDGDLTTVAQAAKWNRLFGGAGILIITDQDPATPLEVEKITQDTLLELRAVDMWELFWSKQNTSDYDTAIDSKDFMDNEFYDYYGKKVHHSRVKKMTGLTAPSFVRPRLRGWGFSVVEALVRSINQYLKANDLGFEVLDEFKLDVFGLKNLANTLMNPMGEAKVRERVQLANQQKNFQNAIVLDSEDVYNQKQLSFTGLAEVMSGIRIQIASDMRMPLTKLFGVSAAGFNSGEDDIEVYNGMVESQIRTKVKFDILSVVELKCQKLFGQIPDDLSIEFKPLRVLSSEQEENVKTQKFNRLLAAKAAGEISSLEFKDACNRDNLLGIQLDTTGEQLDVDGEDPADKQDGETEDETDSAVKGANKKVSTISAKPAKEVKNSLEFEKAAFEADGGNGRYQLAKKPLYLEGTHSDEKLWEECLAKSKGHWQFAVWMYEKHGGKFHS